MFAGTADTIVSYANWQKPTCDQHKAKGNVCEFVSYQGGRPVGTGRRRRAEDGDPA